VQLSVIVAIGLYASFALLDPSIIPDIRTLALIIRFAVVVPIFLMTLVLLPRLRSPHAAQLMLCAVMLVAAGGVNLMLVVSESPDANQYYAGLLLVCSASYTFLRLRFAYAATVSWIVVAVYLATVLAFDDAPAATIVTNLAFLVGINVIGMSAAYLLERQTRLAFLDRLTIDAQASSLRKALRQTQLLAEHDPLTGVYNRRTFFSSACREIEAATENAEPLALALVDIDHFKQINDRLGHAVGDQVLQQVAVAMRTSVRRGELIYRFGGEEFVILLPNINRDAVSAIAERMRSSIEVSCRALVPPILPVTASIGVAIHTGPTESVDALVERADRAMYDAKRLGRNRVVIA
jgi:diguanylate cyclase (GGDEF)-like protein